MHQVTGIDKHRGGNRKTGGALNITVTCTSTDFRVEFLYIFIFINLLGPLQMEVKARVSPMREGRHRIESHLRGYGHVLRMSYLTSFYAVQDFRMGVPLQAHGADYVLKRGMKQRGFQKIRRMCNFDAPLPSQMAQLL